MTRNANITDYGVCYDVDNSPFQVERHGLTFKFSSVKHRDKFVQDVRKREDWLCDSLSRRFKVTFDARLLACVQLYTQVEKRGFYIEDMEGRSYGCSMEMAFNGTLDANGGLSTQSTPTTGGLIG